MEGSVEFPAHEDFVHDVAFDVYGRRLATASSDHHIKVWERAPDGTWTLQADWQAHSGPIWRLSWAHPEYGQVIASCSFDHTVQIWEEQESIDAGRVTSKWPPCAQLGDARQSVKAVEFSPRHLGLKLATASEDGYVRVYEAVDVTNVKHWGLEHAMEVDPAGAECVSWNQSRFDAPTLVVGGMSGIIQIWSYNSSTRKWRCTLELDRGAARGPVHDVAWAPSLGRSFHLIAAACKDCVVRLWKVTLEGGECKMDAFPDLDDHAAEVWRVSWNVTGSMLASTADDGRVRMWKQDLRGSWICVATVGGPPLASGAAIRSSDGGLRVAAAGAGASASIPSFA